MAADLDLSTDGEKKTDSEEDKEPLFERIKSILGDKVKEVRAFQAPCGFTSLPRASRRRDGSPHRAHAARTPNGRAGNKTRPRGQSRSSSRV